MADCNQCFSLFIEIMEKFYPDFYDNYIYSQIKEFCEYFIQELREDNNIPTKNFQEI